MNRDLARVARRQADQQSERIAEARTSPTIIATVHSVTAGAGDEGGNLVTVTWQGAVLTATRCHASYTPVVGDRVECGFVDNQLIVRDKLV